MVDWQENAAAERGVQELRAGRHLKVSHICGTKKEDSVHKVTGLCVLVIVDNS